MDRRCSPSSFYPFPILKSYIQLLSFFCSFFLFLLFIQHYLIFSNMNHSTQPTHTSAILCQDLSQSFALQVLLLLSLQLYFSEFQGPLMFIKTTSCLLRYWEYQATIFLPCKIMHSDHYHTYLPCSTKLILIGTSVSCFWNCPELVSLIVFSQILY